MNSLILKPERMGLSKISYFSLWFFKRYFYYSNFQPISFGDFNINLGALNGFSALSTKIVINISNKILLARRTVSYHDYLSLIVIILSVTIHLIAYQQLHEIYIIYIIYIYILYIIYIYYIYYIYYMYIYIYIIYI